MPHGHLRLDFTGRLQSNADDDEQGGAAEGDGAAGIEGVIGDGVGREGEYRDKGEKQAANKDDFAEYLGDEVRSGLARADPWYKAAVLFEVIGNLDGVEGYGDIKIRESDDQ